MMLLRRAVNLHANCVTGSNSISSEKTVAARQ